MGRMPRWARFPAAVLRTNTPRSPAHKEEPIEVDACSILVGTKLPSSTKTWDSEDTDDYDECLSSSSSKLDSLQSETSLMDYVLSAESKTPRVRFGEAQVRVYPQVLGEHPYCSVGCPLELGWDYQSEPSLTVDDYETHHRCSNSQSLGGLHHLKLSPEQRREILQDKFSDREIRQACRRRSRDQSETNRYCCRLKREFFVYQQENESILCGSNMNVSNKA